MGDLLLIVVGGGGELEHPEHPWEDSIPVALEIDPPAGTCRDLGGVMGAVGGSWRLLEGATGDASAGL